MKYGILSLLIFAISTILHYLLRNGVIMISDIIIGLISSGLFAMFVWYFTLRKFPDKIEKSVDDKIKFFTGKEGNLSNEHYALKNDLSNEHNMLKLQNSKITKYTEYLYNDKLRNESKNSNSNELINNLNTTARKIVELEKENEELKKFQIELQNKKLELVYSLDAKQKELDNSKIRIQQLKKEISKLDKSRNKTYDIEI